MKVKVCVIKKINIEFIKKKKCFLLYVIYFLLFFPLVGESKMNVNFLSIRDGCCENKETDSRSFSLKTHFNLKNHGSIPSSDKSCTVSEILISCKIFTLKT